MMRTLRECPEINTGSCTHVDVPTPPGLLVHRADDKTGTMLFLHNLGDQDATVDVSSLDDISESPSEMFADREYGDIDLAKLLISGYGYRWICLRRKLSL
jgi:maltose alpha-D-glucosyltransferase/alpha-amylase